MQGAVLRAALANMTCRGPEVKLAGSPRSRMKVGRSSCSSSSTTPIPRSSWMADGCGRPSGLRDRLESSVDDQLRGVPKDLAGLSALT